MFSHVELNKRQLLKELIHTFAHLLKNCNAKMVFDPSIPDVNMEAFECKNWDYSISETLRRNRHPICLSLAVLLLSVFSLNQAPVFPLRSLPLFMLITSLSLQRQALQAPCQRFSQTL